MKKTVAAMLAAVMLVTMTACQPSDPGAAPGLVGVETGQTHSGNEGIRVQIAHGDWGEDGFTLKVDWINETAYEGVFGASYLIERKEGEAWVSCQAVEELVFADLGYELSPGQTRTEVYHVSGLFDVSKAGTYRFRSEIHVRDGTDGSARQSVWAEFTLQLDVDDDQSAREPDEYGVQYIRTDGGWDGAGSPGVVIIRSRQELDSYYGENRGHFDLERKEQVYADTTVGFLDACDKYDDAYFERGYLVLVLLEEGSGSVRHEVRDTTFSSDGTLGIHIERLVPEAGTCDMAFWHIILELSDAVVVEDEDRVQVFLDGRPVPGKEVPA